MCVGLRVDLCSYTCTVNYAYIYLIMSKRSKRSLVNAFNLVPVVEQILPDRPKIEVTPVRAERETAY